MSTTSINRIRLEFKASYYCTKKLQRRKSINRIRLEFKEDYVQHIAGKRGGINRIRLEFKDRKQTKIMNGEHEY